MNYWLNTSLEVLKLFVGGKSIQAYPARLEIEGRLFSEKQFKLYVIFLELNIDRDSSRYLLTPVSVYTFSYGFAINLGVSDGKLVSPIHAWGSGD